MKYNKVGVIVTIVAAMLIALPTTSAFAEDQNREDEIKRDKSVESTSTEDKRVSDEHRSDVSKFVKNLLKTADDNRGGIGEEVRKIANEENESASTTTEAIEKIEKRSLLKSFLIGTDYKNVGVIRSQLVKTRARIDQLDRLLEKNTTSTASSSINQQLQTLKQTNDKLTNFVSEQENKFSLFGWFVRLFSK